MDKQANDHLYQARELVGRAQNAFNEAFCGGFIEIRDLKEVECNIKYKLTHVDDRCAHFTEIDWYRGYTGKRVKYYVVDTVNGLMATEYYVDDLIHNNNEPKQVDIRDMINLCHELTTNPNCRHIAKQIKDLYTYTEKLSNVNIRFYGGDFASIYLVDGYIRYCGEVIEGTKTLHGLGTLFVTRVGIESIIHGFFINGELSDICTGYRAYAPNKFTVITKKVHINVVDGKSTVTAACELHPALYQISRAVATSPPETEEVRRYYHDEKYFIVMTWSNKAETSGWILDHVRNKRGDEQVQYNPDGTVSKCTNPNYGRSITIDDIKYELPCNITGTFMYNGHWVDQRFTLKIKYMDGTVESAVLFVQDVESPNRYSERYTFNSKECLRSDIDGTRTVVKDHAFDTDAIKKYIAVSLSPTKCD